MSMRWCALPAAALAIFALTAATATANRGIQLSVGSGELGRVGLSGSWTFKTLEGVPRFRCSIVGTVSLASSIAKVAGTTAGRVTALNFGEQESCNLFLLVLAEDLPWTVSYQGFTGSLPSVTGLQLQLANVRFLYTASGFFRCPFRATLTARGEGNPLSSLSIAEGVANLDRGSEGICPSSMKVDAALRFEPTVRMTLMS